MSDVESLIADAGDHENAGLDIFARRRLLSRLADTLERATRLVAALRSESAEAHSEEGWGFEPMAKLKASIADRIDAALNGSNK